MANFDSFYSESTLSRSIFNTVLFVASILLGLLVSALIAYPLISSIYDVSAISLMSIDTEHANISALRMPLLWIQGIVAMGGFVITPILFWKYIEKQEIKNFFPSKIANGSIFLSIGLLVILLMPVNSVLIEWNKHMTLPSWLSNIEQWMMQREQLANDLVNIITQFSSNGEFIIGIVIIALIPAIGEEFMFRGVLQAQLNRITKNAHGSIWISAALFSAFHLQFYGFLPRMLLGVVFGYLYIWSGNLSLAMFAHFVNNAVTLLLLHLYNRQLLEFNINDENIHVPTSMVLGAMALCFMLFRSIYKLCVNTSVFSLNELQEMLDNEDEKQQHN